MEEQQARLSGDRDADFVGQLEPARALEMLFRQKYLRVAEQLGLIGRGETVEDCKVALEDRAPFWRNRLGAQSGTPSGFEEIENHAED
jgi:hypothetical protein